MIKDSIQNSMYQLIQLALKEDIGSGDVTSRALFGNQSILAKGVFLAKSELVLCGIDILQKVFKKVDPKVQIKILKKEGSFVREGQKIAIIQGSLSSLLKGERVALNFLQHLSGISTQTHRFKEAIRGTKAKILDTRKTLPAWRLLQKHAVKVGGGVNHRMGLYDAFLIKDNHLTHCSSVADAVEKVKKRNRKKLKVEVEVTNLTQLEEAIRAQADWILLDNMPLEDLRLSVIKRNHLAIHSHRPMLEASGGVNFNNIRAVAQTGVDYISVGALTHSVTAADISLEIESK